MANNHLNALLDAGVTDPRLQERAGRMIDAVLAHGKVSPADIVGVGEHQDDICVVSRQLIAMASERGIFNKRVEIHEVGSVASIARLRRDVEGFKGRDGLNIIAHDATGEVQWKISWGLGGPDWVVPAAERESEWLYNVIAQAMDRL